MFPENGKHTVMRLRAVTSPPHKYERNDILKAILKKPYKNPAVIEIDNSLKALQEAVGGYIETVDIGCGVMLLCDEESKQKGLAPNIELRYDFVVGDVLFVQDGGEGEFTDLSEKNIARIMNVYAMPGAEVVK